MVRTLFAALVLGLAATPALAQPQTLPDTKPLTMEGDIASQMIEGIDRFLLKELEASVEKRAQYWKRDFSSPDAYNKSIEPNRKRLAHILGVRDERVKFDAPSLVATVGLEKPGLVGKGDGYDIYAVRWPVLADPDPNRDEPIIHGEGLLLVPTGDRKPVADVIAIPHCDQTPEQIVGLIEGVPAESHLARRLAESGCRVIVPVLINREERIHGITHREFLYRSAFELGRHLIGYEVQKVLACVDWFERERRSDEATERQRERKIGVIGYGEGGMLALYAGALDTRIDAACVSGHFDSRQNIWQEPIDRNVFGFLDRFGDAELVTLVAPKLLRIDITTTPAMKKFGGRGAPFELHETPRRFEDEFKRAGKLMADARGNGWTPNSITNNLHSGVPWIEHLANDLGFQVKPLAGRPSATISETSDTSARHKRQFTEIDLFNQLLLRESEHVRQRDFWARLDLSSLDAYEKSIEPSREQFRDEVIGRFERDLLPANPRSRKLGEAEGVVHYEVMLDVFPDVFAYGILTLPKDIDPSKADQPRRPVVVCQHGLEGRPTDIIQGDHRAYHDFATKLAQRGFITFSPQNIYIFRDRFRTLQRKANPLGKTLFSIMVPQHQQITDWLKSLPYVDSERIAFYGLSYGGKSAMRIPPLVDNYCLSICSADFNEWVDKNASTRHKYSYVWTGEYEIFEWDLGSTFNYAEMAALIAPRPFMVERGHDDGVSSDEKVAYEYAKVRRLYNKLGIGGRTEIEFFNGPHTINGKGTFEFLHRHLDWPKK